MTICPVKKAMIFFMAMRGRMYLSAVLAMTRFSGENGVDEFGNEGGDTVIYFQDYAITQLSIKPLTGLTLTASSRAVILLSPTMR